MATPTPYRTEQLVEWVTRIARDGVNLTAWELDFIAAMERKVDMYGDRASFTIGQAETIDRIFTDRVP